MASEENVFYVRNWRPNVVVFKYAGLKFMLQRRGHREDTTALPVDAKADPTIARWLRVDILEEITREDFIQLAQRIEDEVRPNLKPGKAAAVNIPIEQPHSNTPTVIAKDLKTGKDIFEDEMQKRELMSPTLEWAEEPLSTEEELAEPEEAPVVVKKTRNVKSAT